VELIDALIAALPTADEILLYQQFKKVATAAELDLTSKFALALHQVPQVLLRAHVLRFDVFARKEINTLYEIISAIQRANKMLAAERKFKQLFKIILDFGNNINSGKKWIAGTQAFYVHSVLALADIRANDDSCSMLGTSLLSSSPSIS